MKKVGIVGSSGYVAGELIRLLINHPNVEIDFLFSHSNSGKKVGEIHQDLLFSDLKFSSEINPNIDVLFLCLGHGNSKKFIENHTFSKQTKIIDLSNDFRLKEDAFFQDKNFVYGLVDFQKKEIKKADFIANPGCFATAIQLALLPLAEKNLLKKDLHIHAITGATGAGQKLSETSHFSWRNNNVSSYKAFTHQHLGEISETLNSLQKDFDSKIHFLPIRGDFTRGIFASIYLETDLELDAVFSLFENYYQKSEFVFVTKQKVHLKQVVNTNNCFLQLEKIDGKILITSVIDNLLKGAAGQAVQNMNLLFDFPEKTGLELKATYF
ncbi:N-acetyl-gamma-glutamyl-phosphate reductase [Aureivirga sp. CE67]|uniref:N-acetyl-gamma-glutamyl-phosphate reductase n=1 Tax=Aureivirga sp. CE67 TaxID=1788983 RepID=UPI0018C8DF06|nr:N-acetyl-gamma-glutamyl-phosphate reductase [Aureivirga sp. CE67]